MVVSRSVKGSDLIVYLDTKMETPKAVEIHARMTIEELIQQFGQIIFIKNKNLQSFKNHLQGAIIWVSSMEIIATIVWCNGQHAYVDILYPVAKKGMNTFIDLTRKEGAYLEQLAGTVVTKLDLQFRRKNIDFVTNEIVTSVDKNGCVKMNYHGPDIAKLECLAIPRDIPEEYKAILSLDPFISLNEKKLPVNQDMYKPVAVVYIFGSDDEDSELFKYVDMYVKDCIIQEKCLLGEKIDISAKGMKKKPVYSAPVGSRKNENERYVPSL